jgi:deoxyribodipyrimidine photo-lyase
MIKDEMITRLNNTPAADRSYILYWVQAAQREQYNLALEYAIHRANQLKKPLVCIFALTPDYPRANLRHYHFMISGLAQMKKALLAREIPLAVQLGNPEKIIPEASSKACIIVTDSGYTAIQRKWRMQIAKAVNCEMTEVETDCIVPVQKADNKEAYSAATLRPKINSKLKDYLVPVEKIQIKNGLKRSPLETEDITSITSICEKLRIDNSVLPSEFYSPGHKSAKRLLNDFIKNKLSRYDRDRNNPGLDATSNLSPYLHFGQISALETAIEINKSNSNAKKAFLEELIVRRELARNFTYYNHNYQSLKALPNWARNTLRVHKKDKRQYIYTAKQFENAQTHDPCWNAAQTEMVITGKMHGYMRMYWGKKILEWTNTPAYALKTATELNDKYELDGRDPNGYAGLLWCFGKHDRPWARRNIFGKVRYMAETGLQRKFDMDAYLKKVENLKKTASNTHFLPI